MKMQSFLIKLTDIMRAVYAGFLCPQQCVLCRKTVASGLPLCTDCIQRQFLPYTSPASGFLRCLQCGRILISECGYCTHCRAVLQKAEAAGTPASYCTRIFSLYPYIGLGQKIMPVWKNKNVRSFSAVFAPLVAAFMQSRSELRGCSLVPVPPRAIKMRRKGWDQISDLCVRLSASGITVYPCLKRSGNIPQKQLSKAERLKNIQGKIHVCKKNIPERVLVIDDVMTTGATFEACGQALRDFGCKEVYGLCLFFD